MRAAYCALLACHVITGLRIGPNYLAYFNALASGPAGGYRYLVDSNLDWGQNMWQLRDWMQAEIDLGKDGIELSLNHELEGHVEQLRGLRDRQGRLLFSDGVQDDQALREWLDYYNRLGIESISSGVIT